MKHDDDEAASGATHDSESCGFCSTPLQPPDKTAALTGVRYLEHELSTTAGICGRGITAESANEAVAFIDHSAPSPGVARGRSGWSLALAGHRGSPRPC